jgi:cysteine desulfurase
MIYFDNAATTAVRQEVFEAMRDSLTMHYGNPSSIYKIAKTSKQLINAAREETAKIIGAKTCEIYFTSGGTEANNWAIKGAAEVLKDKGRHIITTVFEHHAVLHPCEYLEKNGYEVTYLPVNDKGLVEISELKKAIRPDTILITIMFANNEIGTIQPVREIGGIAKENGVLFHTDAVQAVGHVAIDVTEMNIDMLSLSAHKMHGPKGCGALYIKKGVKVANLLHGGGQESKKRAGTENVHGIVGLGTACKLALKELESERERLTALRNKIINGVLDAIPHSRLNGDLENRLPGNTSISFEFVEGESILLMLDMKGIAASSGSACTSGSLDPSHVLMAIGLPHEKAHGSLRITLGRYNTEEEVDILLSELPPIIQRFRNMSPLYQA